MCLLTWSRSTSRCWCLEPVLAPASTLRFILNTIKQVNMRHKRVLRPGSAVSRGLLNRQRTLTYLVGNVSFAPFSTTQSLMCEQPFPVKLIHCIMCSLAFFFFFSFAHITLIIFGFQCDFISDPRVANKCATRMISIHTLWRQLGETECPDCYAIDS